MDIWFCGERDGMTSLFEKNLLVRCDLGRELIRVCVGVDSEDSGDEARSGCHCVESCNRDEGLQQPEHTDWDIPLRDG
jgi:hypothetical protein